MLSKKGIDFIYYFINLKVIIEKVFKVNFD